MPRQIIAISVVLLLLLAGTSQAGTVYSSTGPSPTGDDAFQVAVAAAGATLSINDLEGIPADSTVTSLPVGPTTVGVGVADGGAILGGAQIFDGSFAGGGGTATTVLSHSLLNRTAPGTPIRTDIVLTFATPVFAAGVWGFDNSSGSKDQIRWTFTEVGGGTTTQILNANPGVGSHIVEGFVGMTSNLGVTKIVLTSLSDPGGVPQNVAFEIDNLQVGVRPSLVPLPAAAWMGLSLLGGLLMLRRRMLR